MAIADRRLKQPGFDRAKNCFDMSMELLESAIKPQKVTERQSLIGGIYPGWLNYNMYAINGTNFNLKTLKRFYCYRILQLSKEKSLPISAYSRYFDLNKKTKDHMNLDKLLEYSCDLEKLMQRLRTVAYETFLNFVQTEDELVEAGGKTNEKVTAYVEFAHAIVLYDLFVQTGMAYVDVYLDLMQKSINSYGEKEGLPVRTEIENEEPLVYIPLCCVPMVKLAEELVRAETRHVIALYALRTMVQLTEYLSVVEVVTGSRLEALAAPITGRKNVSALWNVQKDNLPEALWQFRVSTRSNGGGHCREILNYNQDKLLRKLLFSDSCTYKEFVTDCQEYLDWMEQWLTKDEEWRMEKDAVITEPNHPEVKMAAIVYTDTEGDLFPSERALWDIFNDAMMKVGKGRVA